MLFKLIKAERLKLKRSPLWLAFLFMPVIPALLGTLNYMANIEILQSEWFSLWTQHTLFTCYFFLPIMIGIYSSYMMRQEENNRNWNKVLSMPVSKNLVFIAKLVQVFFMILFSEIWICTLFVISGKVIGLTSAIPWGKLMIWCLFGTLGGTVIAAIQLYDFPFYQELCTSRRNRTRRGLIRTGIPCKASGAYLALFAYGIRNEFQCTAGTA